MTRKRDAGTGRIIYERDGHIARFIIEGDNDLNPMTPEMYYQLAEALKDYRDDRNLWVGILSGGGDKNFSVGGHLKTQLSREVASDQKLSDKELGLRYWYPRSKGPLLAMIATVEILPLELYKPMIAAIKGYCIGFALMLVVAQTDIKIAADNSKFGLLEIRRGLGGGAGHVQLAKYIPYSIAAYLAMTGELIDAQEAYRVGFVNKVVPQSELMDEAEKMAHKVLKISPIATRIEKESLRKSMDLPRRDAMDYARAISRIVRYGHDAKEGIAAFVEKREPEWEGW